MNPFDLIKFVEENVDSSEQLHALAALADAPGEDLVAKVRLPVQNEIPAFSLGNGKIGSMLAGTNYGVPAPVLGQAASKSPSLGELLIGDINDN